MGSEEARAGIEEISGPELVGKIRSFSEETVKESVIHAVLTGRELGAAQWCNEAYTVLQRLVEEEPCARKADEGGGPPSPRRTSRRAVCTQFDRAPRSCAG